jgi:SAM-dependent methyltransferase
MTDDVPHTAAGTEYLKHTLAGAEYVKQITSLESDRRARSEFQNLVLRIAPPGAALFDFGAGAGIDERFFAERGFTIAAYDADPRMREYFAVHCRDLIDAGRVTLDCRDYREFLGGKSTIAGRVELVISNFAPLNLVDDPHALFAKFHEITGPNGKVLASVLNPFFIGDMTFRWWWRNLPRLWRDGHFFFPGPQAPYFRLTRVFRGLPPYWGKQSDGVDMSRAGRYAWLRVARARFMFLLFERMD